MIPKHFKTDKKPNVNSTEDRQRIQNYHRQLEVYAHIVEEEFGKKVSKLLAFLLSLQMRRVLQSQIGMRARVGQG